MRWLGVWFDRSLRFRTHIEKWSAKARSLAHHLRGLANTKHGPLSSAVQRGVKACVESTLFYGVEAWYPGETGPSRALHKPNKVVSTQISGHIKKMSSALNLALRAILPAWKTTSLPILHRETGIPPVAQLLQAYQLRTSARLHALDPDHPLTKRVTNPMERLRHVSIKASVFRLRKRSNYKTRLQRTYQLLPECPRPILVQRQYIAPSQRLGKPEEATNFKTWL